jgi:hypothetical protein
MRQSENKGLTYNFEFNVINYFTRKRKLLFPTLIAFLIDLATGSYQNELNRFFQLLVPSDLPMKFVSKVALPWLETSVCEDGRNQGHPPLP